MSINYFMITTAQYPGRVTAQYWLGQARVRWNTVVNTEQQIAPARQLGCNNIIVPELDIEAIDRFARLLRIRDWLMETVVPANSWAVFINDNVEGVSLLRSPLDVQDFASASSTSWRQRYAEPLSPTEIHTLVSQIVERCEASGACYGGVGHPSRNYYFCPRRWCSQCYIIGDFMILKNVRQPRIDPRLVLWDDWFATCWSLATSGSVQCCRYAAAVRTRVPASTGIGSHEVRIPYQQRDAQVILEQFPGLVRYRRDCDHELELNVRGSRQLTEWRYQHGYGRPGQVPNTSKKPQRSGKVRGR